MEMPEKGKMIKYFEDLYEKYGYDHRSLDWKDPVGQRLRYAVLFDVVKYCEKQTNFSVLDVGSGLGHFYGYLKEHGALNKLKADYTGYDISPRFVEAAQKKYPEARFEVRDILDGYFTKRFDFIFSCGVFNIRLSSVYEHDAFVKEMIARMYEGCNVAAAFNFLSESGAKYAVNKGEESVYYYYKPDEMVQYVRQFSPRLILRQDYHPADFTIYLLKERR